MERREGSSPKGSPQFPKVCFQQGICKEKKEEKRRRVWGWHFICLSPARRSHPRHFNSLATTRLGRSAAAGRRPAGPEVQRPRLGAFRAAAAGQCRRQAGRERVPGQGRGLGRQVGRGPAGEAAAGPGPGAVRDGAAGDTGARRCGRAGAPCSAAGRVAAPRPRAQARRPGRGPRHGVRAGGRAARPDWESGPGAPGASPRPSGSGNRAARPGPGAHSLPGRRLGFGARRDSVFRPRGNLRNSLFQNSGCFCRFRTDITRALKR